MSDPLPFDDWANQQEIVITVTVDIADERVVGEHEEIMAGNEPEPTNSTIEFFGKLERSTIPAKLQELYDEYVEECENE